MSYSSLSVDTMFDMIKIEQAILVKKATTKKNKTVK